MPTKFGKSLYKENLTPNALDNKMLFLIHPSEHMETNYCTVQQNLWSVEYLLALEVGQNFSENSSVSVTKSPRISILRKMKYSQIYATCIYNVV